MTAYSYQMSNIRTEGLVNLPRGFKKAALENSLLHVGPHIIHHNEHMRDFKEIRYRIFPVESEPESGFCFNCGRFTL